MNCNAFLLLYIIACRAQRTHRFNRFNLKPGEALIGDYRSYGLTERQYRTAKRVLEKFGFATFKATGAGTIATLTGSTIFDVNIEQGDGQNDEQATSERRTADGQVTTTKKENNGNTDNNAEKTQAGAGEVEAFIAVWKREFQSFFGRVYLANPGDDSAARQLLASGSADEVIGVARSAWRNFRSGFHSKHAASISGFAAKFNDIAAENAARADARRLHETF